MMEKFTGNEKLAMVMYSFTTNIYIRLSHVILYLYFNGLYVYPHSI